MKFKKSDSKFYLIGAGIASLASAVYLIKDGKIPGNNIIILEESSDLGGSFDTKPLNKGYVMRGYRMFEKNVYSSTFDLMSLIPLIENPNKTLKDDFFDFNSDNHVFSKCRLIENGKKIDAGHIELSLKDRFHLAKLMLLPEFMLGTSTIADNFSPEFFKKNGWFEVCTAFAFEPWHSAKEFRRYILRFIQDSFRINTLTHLKSTRYNQYDSLVRPIVSWLKDKEVKFEKDTLVTDIDFIKKENKSQPSVIHLIKDGKKSKLSLNENDFIFATVGTMTANSSTGSMTRKPIMNKKKDGAWLLWENLSKKSEDFGKPHVFNKNIKKSKFTGFTITSDNDSLPKLIEEFTGNKAGKGGISTLKSSNWLLSYIIPKQPHIIGQDPNKTVFWGYGLTMNKKGNFVHKTLEECNGKEILTEFCLHFGFKKYLPEILKNSECIPALLPYATSQFLVRKRGDRPKVVPDSTRNFAFLGQFCEIPEDVVFTVEYSVRCAQIAVFTLLNINKTPSPIYHGEKHIKMWIETIKEMNR